MKKIVIGIIICVMCCANQVCASLYEETTKNRYEMFPDRYADYLNDVDNSEYFETAFADDESEFINRAELALATMRLYEKIGRAYIITASEPPFADIYSDLFDGFGLGVYAEFDIQQAYFRGFINGEIVDSNSRILNYDRMATKEEVYIAFSRVLKYFSAIYPDDINNALWNPEIYIQNDSISDWATGEIGYMHNTKIFDNMDWETENFQEYVSSDECIDIMSKIYDYVYEDIGIEERLQDQGFFYWYEYTY